MSETLKDVKPASGSSPSADATANRGMDGNGASSTQSEPSQQDVGNKSLMEHLKQTVPAMTDDAPPVEGAEDTDPKEVVEEENPAEKKEEGDKQAEKEGEEKEAAPSDDKPSEETQPEPEPNKPVPYDRFKEVNDKFRTSEENLRAVEPIVANYQQIRTFCDANQIAPEQFTQALEIQALLNTDPAKALERLVPIVESLQGFVGNKLPDDLQAKVDSGKMELEDAKEMARLKALSTFGEKKVQHSLKQQQQRESQSMQQRLAESITTWETSKRKLDPDYVQGSSKWTMVKNTYLAMLNDVDAMGNYRNPVRTPADVTALMDKAYAEIGNVVKSWNGKRAATRKPLSSNGSSTTSTKAVRVEDAKTLKEAVAIQLAQRS